MFPVLGEQVFFVVGARLFLLERNFFYLKDRGLSWKVDKTSEGEKIQEKRRKSWKEGKNSGRTKKIFERRKKFRKKEEIL